MADPRHKAENALQLEKKDSTDSSDRRLNDDAVVSREDWTPEEEKKLV